MRGRWRIAIAALVVGTVLGAGGVVAGALLLFTDAGLLSSVGLVLGIVVLSLAAGVWAGTPRDRLRRASRWMVAILTFVLASFFASAWVRMPGLHETAWGRPLAVVLLLALPAYAAGTLLVALQLGYTGLAASPRRNPSGGHGETVFVGAAAGVAAGVVLSASILVPSLPPGPIFLGGALLLAMAGSVDLVTAARWNEDAMSDKIVIVTGVGGRGQVGFTLAEAFLRDGARVVVTGRSAAIEEHAAALDAADRVQPVVADLATAAGAQAVIRAALDRWGRLDVLVNVAGGLTVIATVEETEPDAWARETTNNARTAFLMSRAALPALRESRGCIINFASPAGTRAVPRMAAYSAGKAGVVALTRALALEERESGVRVNAVAPGMVDTAQNRESVDDPGERDWVTREEIAAVVLFLASDAGSGINGQTIHVPGRTLS